MRLGYLCAVCLLWGSSVSRDSLAGKVLAARDASRSGAVNKSENTPASNGSVVTNTEKEQILGQLDADRFFGGAEGVLVDTKQGVHPVHKRMKLVRMQG